MQVLFQRLTVIKPHAAVRPSSRRTWKHRADEVSRARDTLSAESSTVLLETELKSVGKDEIDRLLMSAGSEQK